MIDKEPKSQIKFKFNPEYNLPAKSPCPIETEAMSKLVKRSRKTMKYISIVHKIK